MSIRRLLTEKTSSLAKAAIDRAEDVVSAVDIMQEQLSKIDAKISSLQERRKALTLRMAKAQAEFEVGDVVIGLCHKENSEPHVISRMVASHMGSPKYFGRYLTEDGAPSLEVEIWWNVRKIAEEK